MVLLHMSRLTACTYRDAQRELEKTVEGLMEQMDSQQSAASAATAQTQASSQPVDSSEAMTALQDKVQKYEAEIKALNQEVVELETLIETKIFREDELECKIVDLKKALEEALSGNPDVSKASKKAERATRETVKAADASRADRRTNGLSHDSNEAASDADLDDGNCELCGDAHKIEVRKDYGQGQIVTLTAPDVHVALTLRPVDLRRSIRVLFLRTVPSSVRPNRATRRPSWPPRFQDRVELMDRSRTTVMTAKCTGILSSEFALAAVCGSWYLDRPLRPTPPSLYSFLPALLSDCPVAYEVF